MPTIADAFLADVLAHPDDDAVRLIYADWLEENGDAGRAEFIRLQCFLARARPWPPAPGTHDAEDGSFGAGCCCGFCSARRRERQLSVNCGFWGLDLPVPAMPDNGVCAWRRGFVEAVTLAAEDWLRHAGALLAAQPIREVRLTTWPLLEPAQPIHSRRLLGRRKIVQFRKVSTYEEVRQTRAKWPSLGLGGALERTLTPYLLRAEWPDLAFHLPEAAP